MYLNWMVNRDVERHVSELDGKQRRTETSELDGKKLVDWLKSTSQQQTCVSLGQICSDDCTCCHTETEAADKIFHLRNNSRKKAATYR